MTAFRTCSRSKMRCAALFQDVARQGAPRQIDSSTHPGDLPYQQPGDRGVLSTTAIEERCYSSAAVSNMAYKKPVLLSRCSPCHRFDRMTHSSGQGCRRLLVTVPRHCSIQCYYTALACCALARRLVPGLQLLWRSGVPCSPWASVCTHSISILQ